jgi:hypothetical protein
MWNLYPYRRIGIYLFMCMSVCLCWCICMYVYVYVCGIHIYVYGYIWYGCAYLCACMSMFACTSGDNDVHYDRFILLFCTITPHHHNTTQEPLCIWFQAHSPGTDRACGVQTRKSEERRFCADFCMESDAQVKVHWVVFSATFSECYNLPSFLQPQLVCTVLPSMQVSSPF